MKLVLSFFSFLLLSTISIAETFRYDKIYGGFIYRKETPNILYFFTDIQANDDFELSKALRSHEINLIVLASPGGNVWSGLRMADKIFDKNISVYVPSNSICASACSFMFFAGKLREAKGSLGVHQFSSKGGQVEGKVGELQENAQFTVSEIIGRLNLYDTPRFVLEKMFQQKEMYWFDAEEKIKLENNFLNLSVRERRDIDEYWNSFYQAKKKYDEENKTATPNEEINEPNKKVEKPKSVRSKSNEEISDEELIFILQKRLNDLGCNAGQPDGVRGPKTNRALKRYAEIVDLKYHPDILFDTIFIKKLAAENAKRCSSQPPNKLPAGVLPAKIASHWELICHGNEAPANSYARVLSFDNISGRIALLVTAYDGTINSYHGKLSGTNITLFDIEGSFNYDFTEVTFNSPDCPGGLIGQAAID